MRCSPTIARCAGLYPWRAGKLIRGVARIFALAAICLPMPVRASAPYDPAAPYAAAYLGGNYQQAITEVEQAIGKEFGLPPVLWSADQAELYFLTGRYDEAIAVMGDVVRRVYEPVFTERLAEFYRHVGRADDARDAMDLAIQQNRGQYRQDYPRENLLAMGRIAQLRGESPRQILQIFQQRILQRNPEFVEGFVAAGNLALESYGYDVAEEYFLAALALDAVRQPALAGLAETYYRAGDPRFEQAAEMLAALNPHHPDLLRLRAEQALMAGDAEKANAILDELMAINPSHHAGLAFRAAAAFLKGDTAAQEASMARLKELRPGSAEGYRVLGDLAARRYRFDEAVQFLRTGLAQEGDYGPAKASLGMNLLRLGEDETGRVLLEEVFEEDPYNVQVYNMLEVLDTLDGFPVVSNADFQLRLPKEEAGVMGTELLAFLGEALARYSEEYGVAVKRPIYVQMFDDHDDFMVRSIGLPGNAGHLGICFGSLVTLDSPRARELRTMNWRSVLWHEFVHVITLQKTENRIPRWLSEGISAYEEGQRDPAWGQPLDPDFAPLLSPAAWPELAALEAYFVAPESPTHLLLGYFLAGAFVEAYTSAYGKPALVAALGQMAEGKEAIAALISASGADEVTVNGVFSAHLDSACAPLWRLQPGPSAPADPASAATEVATFADLINKGFMAREDDDIDQAIVYYEEAATLFPAYPGEENPLRALVSIRRQQGNLPQWYAAVLRLQHYDPTAYAESAAVLEALAEAGQWPEVVSVSDWCAGIDPFDAEVCTARRRAQEALGDNAGLLDTLDRLAVLDPGQAENYRLAKVRALGQLHRTEEARYLLLTLLEAYPEYGEAQALLLELHAQSEAAARENS